MKGWHRLVIPFSKIRAFKNMANFFMPREFGKTMLIMHVFGMGACCETQ